MMLLEHALYRYATNWIKYFPRVMQMSKFLLSSLFFSGSKTTKRVLILHHSKIETAGK